MARRRLRRLAIDLAILAGFLIAAVVITWPLVLEIGTAVPGGGPLDNITFLWSAWWAREALTPGSPAELFSTHALFVPYGTSLAAHTHAYFNAILGATVLGRFTIVEAQNLLLVVSIALNGFCACLLSRWVTGRTDVSLVAGLYFASSPYVAGHLAGHFNLVPAWFLPLFALTWLRTLDSRSWLLAFCTGVVLGLTAWSDYYYVAYELVFVAVTLGYRLVSVASSRRPKRSPTPVDWALLVVTASCVGVAAAIKVTGGGVFFVQGVRVSATTGLPLLAAAWAFGLVWSWRRSGMTIRIGRKTGAEPLKDVLLATMAGLGAVAVAWPVAHALYALWSSGDYVSPERHFRSGAEGIDLVGPLAGNPFGTFWPSWIGTFYDFAAIHAVENTSWIGFAGWFGLAATLTARDRGAARIFWLTVCVTFWVWALGPYLRVLGQHAGLPLPSAALLYVPGLANVRIPGRAVVMVYLALSVLLALAVADRTRAPRTRWLWPAAIALIVFVDFLSVPIPLYRLDSPALYQHLAARPGGAVLELPTGIRDGFGGSGVLDHDTLFYQTIHHKPLVGGFVGRTQPSLRRQYLESPVWSVVFALSEGQAVAREALETSLRLAPDVLSQSGVRYVVLSKDAPAALRDWAHELPLERIEEDDRRVLYGVVPR